MSERRLAAIMFTDIVGYDSLLKEDEKKAFEILRKNQRIQKRLIKKFNGRWFAPQRSMDLLASSLVILRKCLEVSSPVRDAYGN